jgi:cell division septation protein DedD
MSMVLDYSERKPVSKNRPRKQPVGMFVLVLLGAVSISYVLGLTTGWFLFKSRGKTGPGQVSAVAAGQAGAGATAVPPPYANPDATASRGGEPPLTFYETLPKGGKAVIGSGLNPKSPDAPPVPLAAVPAKPSPQAARPQTVAPSAAIKQESAKEKSTVPAEQPKKVVAPSQDGGGKFCVQVASSQDRKDADALRDKLAAKGFPAYVVESRIKDKGTWYRVRIGKHLSQQAAGEMAGKAGKGALVIPE